MAAAVGTGVAISSLLVGILTQLHEGRGLRFLLSATAIVAGSAFVVYGCWRWIMLQRRSLVFTGIGVAALAFVLSMAAVLERKDGPPGSASKARAEPSAPTTERITTSSTRLDALTGPDVTKPEWAKPHFRPSDYEKPLYGVFRAFGQAPNYIPEFPITMNGCDSRAMRTRWRTVSARIQNGVVAYSSNPHELTVKDAWNVRVAQAGVIDTGGCEQPVFFLEGVESLADIAYETVVYNAAP